MNYVMPQPGSEHVPSIEARMRRSIETALECERTGDWEGAEQCWAAAARRCAELKRLAPKQSIWVRLLHWAAR